MKLGEQKCCQLSRGCLVPRSLHFLKMGFFLFKMKFVNGTRGLLCWMRLCFLILSSYTRNFAKFSFLLSPSLPNPPSHINWQHFMSTLWQFLLHSRREECTGQIVQHSFAKTLSCFSSRQTQPKINVFHTYSLKNFYKARLSWRNINLSGEKNAKQ